MNKKDKIVLEVEDGGFCKLPEIYCKRCGHIWVPRTKKLPKVCPNCKNPNWNKERN